MAKTLSSQCQHASQVIMLCDKLEKALRDLVDTQNGPPLIRYADEWESAMRQAEEALKGGN